MNAATPRGHVAKRLEKIERCGIHGASNRRSSPYELRNSTSCWHLNMTYRRNKCCYMYPTNTHSNRRVLKWSTPVCFTDTPTNGLMQYLLEMQTVCDSIAIGSSFLSSSISLSTSAKCHAADRAGVAARTNCSMAKPWIQSGDPYTLRLPRA